MNKEKEIGYLAGDYNIDLLKFETHLPTSDYVNCMFSQSFLPSINKPTRVTDISATLIDNSITNANLSNVILSIIYSDISDHFPIFLQTDVPLKPIKQPRVIFKRHFTNAKDRKSTRLNSSHRL